MITNGKNFSLYLCQTYRQIGNLALVTADRADFAASDASFSSGDICERGRAEPSARSRAGVTYRVQCEFSEVSLTIIVHAARRAVDVIDLGTSEPAQRTSTTAAVLFQSARSHCHLIPICDLRHFTDSCIHSFIVRIRQNKIQINAHNLKLGKTTPQRKN